MAPVKMLILLLLVSVAKASWRTDLEVILGRMTQAAYDTASHENLDHLLSLLKADGSFSDLKYGQDNSESFRTHGRRQSALLYHHLNGKDLTAEILTCDGAWLDHGPSPEGAGHAYAVLPAADVDKTRLFAAEPDVEVLSRTASLHAVCHGPSQTIGAAFVQAGELTSSCGPSAEVSLLVDTPCLALVSVSSESADAAELSVTLADPQQMYDVIRIRVTYGGREAEQTVQMPFPPLGGSSITVVVSV